MMEQGTDAIATETAETVVPRAARLLDVASQEKVRRAGTVRRGVDTSPHAGRKPDWLKVQARFGENYRDLTGLVRDQGLATVCQQARCPNIFECWEMREATFLIGGEDCTRRCGFCQIKTGKPAAYDREEPARVAASVAEMGLRYAVVTMVARDDLADGGAWLVAETIRAIRATVPGCGVEVLPSDFGYGHDRSAGLAALDQVVAAQPDVFAFNVETVERLYPVIRPAFDYRRSLEFLAHARERMPAATAIKSNIIVGMGETDDEVVTVMGDLRAAGVQTLTIGQYLQPSDLHLHLDRYVTPEQFATFKRIGEDELGFDHVESGPMVRSSYHAGKQAQSAGVWSPPTPAPPAANLAASPAANLTANPPGRDPGHHSPESRPASQPTVATTTAGRDPGHHSPESRPASEVGAVDG